MHSKLKQTGTAIDKGLTHACEPMQGFTERMQSLVHSEAESSPYWAPFTEQPSTIPHPSFFSQRDEHLAGEFAHVGPGILMEDRVAISAQPHRRLGCEDKMPPTRACHSRSHGTGNSLSTISARVAYRF